MRIYLIGFMGCGKTTVGQVLAKELGLTFVDLDHNLEEQTQLTIAEIFSKYGEPAFRQFEKDALEHTFSFDNIVVSTGGGCPCYFDNIELINKYGQSFYLEVSPQILAQRISHDKTRPLVAQKTGEELLSFIQNKFIEREPSYSKASHKIEAEKITVEEIAEKILKIIKDS